MLLILSACLTQTVQLPPVGTQWQGEVEDEGFGASLAASEDGATIVAGAPWAGGRIYQLASDGTVTVLAGGAHSLGVGLAVDGEEVWSCAPATGTLVVGERVQNSAHCTGRIRSLDGPHVIDGATVGSHTPALSRVSDVARVDGVRAFSSTTDPATAVLVGDRVLVARESPSDSLGHALCASDLDGDGDEDLVVAAPALNQVRIFLEGEPTVIRGEGRFGQDISCSPGLLVVGAPLYGDGGAVWAFQDGLFVLGDPLVVGESGEQLGTSVLALGQAVLAGAPGTPSTSGRVIRAR